MGDLEIIESLFAVAGTIVLIFIIIMFIASIFFIIAQWNLFKKAGKKGWESLIPFYNTWVLIEISGLNWWYFLIAISGTILALIRLESLSGIAFMGANFVNFLCYYNIAKKMQQNEILYGILGALVPFVAVLILGFSKNITYDDTIVVNPNGPIGNQNSNDLQSNTTPERYCIECGQKINHNSNYCTNCGRKI